MPDPKSVADQALNINPQDQPEPVPVALDAQYPSEIPFTFSPVSGPDGHADADVYQGALQTLTEALMDAFLLRQRLDLSRAQDAPQAVWDRLRQIAQMAVAISDLNTTEHQQAHALRDVMDEFELEPGEGKILMCQSAIRHFRERLISAGSTR
jgi:hypothetical protein